MKQKESKYDITTMLIRMIQFPSRHRKKFNIGNPITAHGLDRHGGANALHHRVKNAAYKKRTAGDRLANPVKIPDDDGYYPFENSDAGKESANNNAGGGGETREGLERLLPLLLSHDSHQISPGAAKIQTFLSDHVLG